MIASCSGQRPSTELPRKLPAGLPTDGGLLRVSAAGGWATMLRGDSLRSSAWRVTGIVPLARALGVDRDDRLAYFLSNRGGLVAIDLKTRGARVLPASWRQATVASDGIILGLDSANHALRLANREVTTFRSARVLESPVQLFRAPGELISAYSAKAHQVQVLRDKGEVRRIPAPDGVATSTWYGDILAITNESGVTLIDPIDPKTHPPTLISVRGSPLVSAFTPSGHRLMVARQHGDLLVIDRFSHATLFTIKLPGIAGRLRVDRSGRWLLAAPVQGDSVWLVDLVRGERTFTFASKWRDDLPDVLNGRTLIFRQGLDVIAFDITGAAPVQRARLARAAEDLFLPVSWSPADEKRVALSAAEPGQRNDSLGTVTPTTKPGSPPPRPDEPTPAAAALKAPIPGIYVQISSSQNPLFSEERAKQLLDSHLPARVLTPETPDQGYRVVLGPYPTRDAAEAVGKRLGQPYFILTLGPPDR